MSMQGYGVITGAQGRSQEQSGQPTIVAMSLREMIEANILYYKPVQNALTLNPSGTATDRATMTFQPDAASMAAMLMSLAFDATPSMVSVAGVDRTYNLAEFGNPGTNNLLLTVPWLRQNIIPENAMILLSRSAVMRVTVTNIASYIETVNAVAILGFINIEVLNKILALYGREPIPM